MKKTKVLSGNFSSGEGKQGNFSGYNTKGERIFINKRQMESIGMTKDSDVKPFYALIDIKDINTLDGDGNPTNVLVKRLQALSVFKTEAELIEAVNADELLDIKATSELKAAATSAGLTEAAVNALLSASV